MLVNKAYLAIKKRLSEGQVSPAIPAIAGVQIFFYIGQYLPGKDNTSYMIPAIYIEFPKDFKIDFFPKKRMVSKAVEIKIHYISYAPYKNHDNATQDAALLQHDNNLKVIDKLLNGWHAEETGSDKLLTQQFITSGGSFLNFMDKAVVSIINYQTEIYSSHLQGVTVPGTL